MEYSIIPKRFGRKENNSLSSKEDNWIIRVNMGSISNIKEGQDYLYNNYTNYEVENLDSSQKECYIFFSSNGIYEDSFDKFYRTMIEENRYEWKSIAEAVKKRKQVAKIIYVRDVYKRFYIHGISKEINSISKLLDKLKELTEGYKVITIGISSGGYMAVVSGSFLGAEKVFSISGQFEVGSHISVDEINKMEEKDKEYLNVASKIKDQNKIKIFYFCPIGCEDDRANYELIKNIDNVNHFLFSSDKHADTVYPFNFPDIFCAKTEKLEDLAQKNKEIVMTKTSFVIKTFTYQGVLEFIIRAMNVKFNKQNIKKIWDVKL